MVQLRILATIILSGASLLFAKTIINDAQAPTDQLVHAPEEIFVRVAEEPITPPVEESSVITIVTTTEKLIATVKEPAPVVEQKKSTVAVLPRAPEPTQTVTPTPQPDVKKDDELTSVQNNVEKVDSSKTSEPDKSTPAQEALTNAGVLSATNAARQEQGVPVLKLNNTLNAIANDRLKDMFAEQYFAHASPVGNDMIALAKKYQYAYRFIGENIAMGNYATSAAMVDGWMNSPGHRANILNTNYKEIGIAVGKGSLNGRDVWIGVQIFGTSR